ncbi:MAG: hypothetical protein SVU32_03540 [Candidatus Nanohaloarchaea archaeon]|nr:hypothetical protein [Candidatus Nanohaloarchaea archaeon]
MHPRLTSILLVTVLGLGFLAMSALNFQQHQQIRHLRDELHDRGNRSERLETNLTRTWNEIQQLKSKKQDLRDLLRERRLDLHRFRENGWMFSIFRNWSRISGDRYRFTTFVYNPGYAPARDVEITCGVRHRTDEEYYTKKTVDIGTVDAGGAETHRLVIQDSTISVDHRAACMVTACSDCILLNRRIDAWTSRFNMLADVNSTG